MRSDSVCGKSRLNPVGGFTLVELLIAMAAGLVVLGAAYQGFTVQRKMYGVQEQVTEMLQNARAAVDFMARELRSASAIVTLDTTSTNSSITYVSINDACQNRGFSLSSNTLRYYAHCPDPALAGCPQPTYAHPAPGTSCPLPTAISRQPLAENISGLTITRAGSLFTITLIARTSAKDTALGRYRSITISSNVRARCMSAGTTCS